MQSDAKLRFTDTTKQSGSVESQPFPVGSPFWSTFGPKLAQTTHIRLVLVVLHGCPMRHLTRHG